jgi:transcription elongation GreA/GreB family factor
LEIVQVVDPTQQKNLDQVFFGATVTPLMSGERSERSPSSASTRPISLAAK